MLISATEGGYKSLFVSLSSLPALVKLTLQRNSEAREADESSRVTLGNLQPPKICKIDKKRYQLADDKVMSVPLAWPLDTPSHMSKVECTSWTKIS